MLDLLDKIEDLKKAGSIVMQHKNVLLHKNGAKVPIAKGNIEDEFIKKNQIYTVTLILEG